MNLTNRNRITRRIVFYYAVQNCYRKILYPNRYKDRSQRTSTDRLYYCQRQKIRERNASSDVRFRTRLSRVVTELPLNVICGRYHGIGFVNPTGKINR